MSLPVEIRPDALAELHDAYRWYNHEKAGLGEEFVRDILSKLLEIGDHPERFPVIHRRTRRALLLRFPYSIFYTANPIRVVVVSCFHAKRRPAVWKSRT